VVAQGSFGLGRGVEDCNCGCFESEGIGYGLSRGNNNVVEEIESYRGARHTFISPSVVVAQYGLSALASGR
jgi:hypothetical protein